MRGCKQSGMRPHYTSRNVNVYASRSEALRSDIASPSFYYAHGLGGRARPIDQDQHRFCFADSSHNKSQMSLFACNPPAIQDDLMIVGSALLLTWSVIQKLRMTRAQLVLDICTRYLAVGGAHSRDCTNSTVYALHSLQISSQ